MCVNVVCVIILHGMGRRGERRGGGVVRAGERTSNGQLALSMGPVRMGVRT